MPTTATLLLPYPAPSDPADVPTDMGELATRLETVRGQPNGLAGLDAGGKAPVAQLPAGVANGVASLGADGKVPAAQLPAISGSGELGYAQITANVTCPVVAAASAATVVTLPAITFDGATAILLEFFGVFSVPSGAQGYLNLWDGSTDLGFWGQMIPPAAQMHLPVMLRRKLTPSAAAHTYSVRGWAVTAAASVIAANGGVGQFQPASLRAERA